MSWVARIRTTKEDRRGAALIEVALLVLPICLLAFGAADFGFAYRESIDLSNGTRAGARMATAESINPDALDLGADATMAALGGLPFDPKDEIRIYKVNAAGVPYGTCPSATCNVYRFHNSGKWNKTSGSWAPLQYESCFSKPRDGVVVEATLTHKGLSGFFPSRTLRESSQMTFEPDADC